MADRGVSDVNSTKASVIVESYSRGVSDVIVEGLVT